MAKAKNINEGPARKAKILTCPDGQIGLLFTCVFSMGRGNGDLPMKHDGAWWKMVIYTQNMGQNCALAMKYGKKKHAIRCNTGID